MSVVCVWKGFTALSPTLSLLLTLSPALVIDDGGVQRSEHRYNDEAEPTEGRGRPDREAGRVMGCGGGWTKEEEGRTRPGRCEREGVISSNRW